MTRCGERDTGLTANTVRRWETGERRADPRYRKHLVSIMGKLASELGLLTSDELRMRPDLSASYEIGRLLEVLGRDTSGIDGLCRSLLLGLGDSWKGADLDQRLDALAAISPEHVPTRTPDALVFRSIVAMN